MLNVNVYCEKVCYLIFKNIISAFMWILYLIMKDLKTIYVKIGYGREENLVILG